MEIDAFDLLDDKPPRTVMDDIESNTRSVDEQAGAILFELQDLARSTEAKLSDLVGHTEWVYSSVSPLSGQLKQIKTVLWCIAALLALIAIQLAT